MQLVSAHQGRLYLINREEHSALLGAAAGSASAEKTFTTGLPLLDEMLPNGALARAAVHEILAEERDGTPLTFALLLARSAAREGAIVWCDPRRTLYPPAVAAMGMPLDRLFLLRPKTPAEQIWAVAESMGCPGVAATVAMAGDLSRVEARRFQLAAERGGGVGILLRDPGKATQYAAATRWRVRPMKSQRSVQRWSVQLIHGHGGQIGKPIILESPRGADAIQANPLRAVAPLADRPVEKTIRTA
jgi:protein ImuA